MGAACMEQDGDEADGDAAADPLDTGETLRKTRIRLAAEGRRRMQVKRTTSAEDQKEAPRQKKAQLALAAVAQQVGTATSARPQSVRQRSATHASQSCRSLNSMIAKVTALAGGLENGNPSLGPQPASILMWVLPPLEIAVEQL